MAEKTTTGNLVTDIPGLQSRISNPLDVLGLYGTLHEACHRHHIPALCVTGNANEEQIIAAGKVNWLKNHFLKSRKSEEKLIFKKCGKSLAGLH